MLLSAIFTFSLVIRVFLINARWINPDEGAHLMDALLLLQGKLPYIEFESRQPLYVLANAFFLQFFGVNLIAGRLLPMVCSLLSGVAIFFIARRIFNESAAVLSAVIYWLLPLEIVKSVIVKTEPLNMLLICSSVVCLLHGIEKRSAMYWCGAGLLAAAAYYVRQSALVVPLVVVIALIISLLRRRGEIGWEILGFFIGYGILVLVVLLFYSRYVPWLDLLGRGLNPLGFLLKAVLKTLNTAVSVGEGPLLDQGAEQINLGLPLYIRYAKVALWMHLFLIAGFGLSVLKIMQQLLSHKKTQIGLFPGVMVLQLWFFGLVLAYIYYFWDRGFFIDYFRELIPPLIILFSGWAVATFGNSVDRRRWIKLISFLLLAAFAGCCIVWIYPRFSNAFLFLAVCLLGLALYPHGEGTTKSLKWASACTLVVALIAGFGLMRIKISGAAAWVLATGLLAIAFGTIRMAVSGQPGFNRGEWQRSVCLALMAGIFSLSMAHSIPVIDRRYDSVWSPEVVREVAAMIGSHSRPNDEVLSGGVIWEYAAGRRPFALISHPLIYRDSMNAQEKERIGKLLQDFPPALIVKDGYTEKTYFQHFPWMDEFLEKRYSVTPANGAARYPVLVYARIDG